MHRGKRLGRSGERGAIAVELIVVLPILLLLVFGIVNFGVVLSQQIALSNAVREAARAAVVAGNLGGSPSPTTCAGIEDTAEAAAQAPGLDSTTISFPYVGRVDSSTLSSKLDCATEAASTVICEGSYDVTTPIATRKVDSVQIDASLPAPLWFTGGNITLEARAVYQCEFSAVVTP